MDLGSVSEGEKKMTIRAGILCIPLALATPAIADALDPSDPGDRAIIQSHGCNTNSAEKAFSAEAGAYCMGVHDSLTRYLNVTPSLGAAQRNKVQLARSMSFMSALASQAKADGAITSRICAQLPRLGALLDAYAKGLTPQWDGLNARQREALRSMRGKCP